MAKTLTPLDNMSSFLEKFRVPGLDFDALNDARRKDVEARVEANRIALEGMQALARKQVEVFQSTMAELQSLAAPATSGKPALSDMSKQAQLVQQVWQRAVGDMRDLAEVVRKSQTDALATVGQRATQNLRDMRRSGQAVIDGIVGRRRTVAALKRSFRCASLRKAAKSSQRKEPATLV